MPDSIVPNSASIHASLDHWISSDVISFSIDSPMSLGAAIDQVLRSLGDSVELLGIGEAMHGGEELMILRDRLFQHLVEKHGYTAIALESSFSRGPLINDYANGRAKNADGSPATYDEVHERGFSHFFGRLEANRDLVEWMRVYNSNPSHRVKLHFYGFDSPTENMWTDSPRQMISVVLDFLADVDGAMVATRRERIESLIGNDTDWETPEAAMNPSKSIGHSPAAISLRIDVEDLITELQIRRPELVAKRGVGAYQKAMHYAVMVRQLLSYHATIARQSDDRLASALGQRDAMMAYNLAYIVELEKSRGGKVLVFAHNSHLKYETAKWQLGPYSLEWWPAGAHMRQLLGSRYAVIGTGVAVSAQNGIKQPEEGTLEAKLTAAPGPARLIPTHNGNSIPQSEIASLPSRSNVGGNPSYFPFTNQSFTEFDWLVVLDSVTYSRGGPQLPNAAS